MQNVVSSRLALVTAAVIAGSVVAGLAHAGATWVIWSESPEGSDLWSAVRTAPPAFESAEQCRRRAQEFNDLEVAFAKMQGAQAHDVFVCLPDTVDPRPEGALLLDTGKPAGPREEK